MYVLLSFFGTAWLMRKRKSQPPCHFSSMCVADSLNFVAKIPLNVWGQYYEIYISVCNVFCILQ